MLAVHYLGSHPTRRADEGPGLLLLHGAFQHARHAQVAKTNVAFGIDQNVAGLDISRNKELVTSLPVKEIRVVQILQPLRRFANDVRDNVLLRPYELQKKRIPGIPARLGSGDGWRDTAECARTNP